MKQNKTLSLLKNSEKANIVIANNSDSLNGAQVEVEYFSYTDEEISANKSKGIKPLKQQSHVAPVFFGDSGIKFRSDFIFFVGEENALKSVKVKNAEGEWLTVFENKALNIDFGYDIVDDKQDTIKECIKKLYGEESALEKQSNKLNKTLQKAFDKNHSFEIKYYSYKDRDIINIIKKQAKGEQLELKPQVLVTKNLMFLRNGILVGNKLLPYIGTEMAIASIAMVDGEKKKTIYSQKEINSNFAKNIVENKSQTVLSYTREILGDDYASVLVKELKASNEKIYDSITRYTRATSEEYMEPDDKALISVKKIRKDIEAGKKVSVGKKYVTKTISKKDMKNIKKEKELWK